MKKEEKIRKIIKDIKAVKIQGARNIAKAALYAYSLLPTKTTKEKLMKARPTEPMLANTLKNFETSKMKFLRVFRNQKISEKLGCKKTLEHFSRAQEKINSLVYKIIKNNSIIFTHCHSTNVINALIYAKKHGRKFQVYNTETRPLFQGRKTSLELRKAEIKVTMFADSAARLALMQAKKIPGIDLVFFGADAILKSGIINKIGSGMFAEIAYNNKIPVYIIADSWKFAKHVELEERSFNEIWKTTKIKIKNPSFELVPKKYIKSIVSELGVLSLDKFVKKVIKQNN